jgi:FtsH-binding integral membrane protein
MRLLSGVGPLWIFIGYFVLAIAGIAISARSTNPWISFLGYNLLVLPIGVLLCLILPGIPVAIVTKALLLTGIVTATMTLLGLVAPNVFLGMGRTLFIALIVGILAELVATFLFHYTGTAFDWLFVVLFSGYIGYDVAKSQIYPKTVDNAVDCALDIYLDIINIFIRLLALLSRKE